MLFRPWLLIFVFVVHSKAWAEELSPRLLVVVDNTFVNFYQAIDLQTDPTELARNAVVLATKQFQLETGIEIEVLEKVFWLYSAVISPNETTPTTMETFQENFSKEQLEAVGATIAVLFTIDQSPYEKQKSVHSLVHQKLIDQLRLIIDKLSATSPGSDEEENLLLESIYARNEMRTFAKKPFRGELRAQDRLMAKRYGCTESEEQLILGNHVLMKNAGNLLSDSKIIISQLIHQFGHLYGALHTHDQSSYMCFPLDLSRSCEIQGDRFDEQNLYVIQTIQKLRSTQGTWHPSLEGLAEDDKEILHKTIGLFRREAQRAEAQRLLQLALDAASLERGKKHDWGSLWKAYMFVFQSERIDQSIELTLRSLQLDPENCIGWNLLTDLYLLRKDSESLASIRNQHACPDTLRSFRSLPNPGSAQ